MCPSRFLILVKIAFLMIHRSSGSNNATAENVTSLRRLLLQNYDPYLRPRKLQTDPIIIDAHFGVNRLHDLSEKDGKMSVLGYFEFSWIDEFLTWDEEKHQNISDIVVKTDDIWWPTIGLGNPIGDFETLRNPNGIFRISSTGLIKWTPGGLFSTMCDMDVQKYPFDTQTCNIIFVVLGYNPTDVIINANPNVLKMRDTKEWTVVSSHVFAYTLSYSGLTVTLKLQRKPSFLILTVVMPLTLLSFLNILVFLVPIESGEKTSYAITTFLAYSIYLSAMGTSLPDDAEKVVYLTLYIELLMFLSVLITLLVIIQIRLGIYHGDRLPPFCPINHVGGEGDDVITTAGEKDKSFGDETTKRKIPGGTWASRMIVIDRILFMIFLFVLGLLNVIFFTLMSS